MITPGEMILLLSPKGKRFLRRFEPEGELHTHDGKLLMADVGKADMGGRVKTHTGRVYTVLKPTVHDLIKGVKRHTQIMYPKEIGYLLLKLSVGPGATVVEAGSGSGGLTVALAHFVGDSGMVHTFERRSEFSSLAAENLGRVGLAHRVTFHNRDVAEEGFGVQEADALFLDVRTPWECLGGVARAVQAGAMTGYLLPTVNQVSELLAAMEGPEYGGLFSEIEVLEILVRRWKAVSERMRPDDRMVAHTGFLVFARCLGPRGLAEPVESSVPPKPEYVPPEKQESSGEEPLGDEAAEDEEPCGE